MKLINKTQRIYLLLVVIILLVWSIIFMIAIYSAIEENIDETLHSELLSIIKQGYKQNLIQPVLMQEMAITPIATPADTAIIFSDTTMLNTIEQESFLYRQIRTQISIGEKAWQITLRRSMLEYDDLFEAILVMELIFVLLLVAGLFIINKKILQRLWHPFHKTLKQITDYQIGHSKDIEWKETEIDEFKQLNQVLERMIDQIEREYESLKQFTENASHEIQTPLSVILNKIEILLQDESLKEEQNRHLYSIQQTAAKLSRLNKALLMLTKIKNRQFNNKKKLNLSNLLQELLQDYGSLAQSRDITLKQNIEPNVFININAELAELMLRNLLGNAVKHNKDGGYINVELDEVHLIIQNEGKITDIKTSQFFERFQKGKGSTNSLGLGLSIVSAIAESNEFSIAYSIQNKEHCIEVIFG